ncbi:hypothetical protein D3C73_1465630 [compost metagenome]
MRPQTGLFLAEELIQLGRAHRCTAEHGMDLPTVMDLVLEQVGKQAQPLFTLHTIGPYDAHVAR